MATLQDWLNRLGYQPVGASDPFAPFRGVSDTTDSRGNNIYAPHIPVAYPNIPNVVPMFKRPVRFFNFPIAAVNAFNLPDPDIRIPGVQIVNQNANRVGLIITNMDAGRLFYSTSPNVSIGDQPLDGFDSLTIIPSSSLINAPTNPLYAIVQDVPADIRVIEIVLAPIGTEFIA
jgi:hypothetical protein